MDLQSFERLLLPLLFGVAAAAMVGVLRGFGSLRRLRIWAVLTGISAGAYLAVLGSEVRYQATILQVLSAVVLLSGTAAILRLIDLFFWDWFLGRRRHVPVPRLAVDLFKLLAIVGVAIAILKFIFGMELSGLLVTSTVVSAVIGLAIQDMLANVAAGLGVQLERPFDVGDWLHIGAHEGVVTQLNWRTLTLLTRDRHEILVPNSTVAKTEVINFSRPSTVQRVHVFIGLAYRYPPGVVKAALMRATVSCPEVLTDPPVEIFLRGYQDSSIEYDVRFWINDFSRLFHIKDDVQSRCWYELKRCDLTIPFPQRDVHLRTVSDEQEKLEAERRRYEIFTVLRPLDVFAPLSDDQIRALVDGASLQVFMLGEELVRQGERGESLFVIRSGRVRVDRSRDSGPATTITMLSAGDFFGEMSLLTGEPRTASVIAEDETQVVVVDKDAFAAVLAADTGILPGLSAALEERARHTEKHLAETSTTSTEPDQPQAPSALRRQISRFFGLDEH